MCNLQWRHGVTQPAEAVAFAYQQHRIEDLTYNNMHQTKRIEPCMESATAVPNLAAQTLSPIAW